MPVTELDWLLIEQDGVLTTAQAAALLGRARTRTLLDSGRWRRVCRGVLISHNGPLTAGQALWVAVLAAGDGAARRPDRRPPGRPPMEPARPDPPPDPRRQDRAHPLPGRVLARAARARRG